MTATQTMHMQKESN